MSRYGLSGKIVAVAGRRDALVGVLVRAAHLVSHAEGCELYVVSTLPGDAEAVWVSEIWRSEADHAASLQMPGVRELIAEGRPLIASFGDRIVHSPVGGVGLRD